jgi:outer membrane protein assembly factor BamB
MHGAHPFPAPLVLGLALVLPPEGGSYGGVVLVVFDAKTGEKKYESRLAGATSAFTASPVANDGKAYIASEDGQIFVVAAGPTYQSIAMNEMSAPVLATPAISEGRLLLRTQTEVLAIGRK